MAGGKAAIPQKRLNIEFALLMAAALFVSWIPLISLPLEWVETYFHELSHGIASLITGGSIEKITLHLFGSGTCTTAGGWRFLILNAGYIGAVLWGILIYEMADEISHKHTSIIATVLAGLIALTALLYARDVMTWIIMAVLIALFVSIVKLQDLRFGKLALKFIGLYILLSAVTSPLHLLDGRHFGDGAKLADLTAIPELFWMLLWVGIGAVSVFYLWKMNQKTVT